MGPTGGGVLCGDGSYCYGGFWCNQTPGGTGACKGTDPCDGAGGTLSCGGTSGTTSGGSSSGGYAGGCQPSDYFTSEFGDCSSAGGATCSCGQVCATDTNMDLANVGGDGQYCETPCTSSAQCPDPQTFCSGGSCVYNDCTSIYTACTGGFCLPTDLAPQGEALGVEADFCIFNGSGAAGATCDLAFANDLTDNCASGLICIATTQGATSGTCTEACDPDGTTGPTCGGGTSCTGIDTSVTDLGVCQ
jgi:hypothetical protein